MPSCSNEGFESSTSSELRASRTARRAGSSTARSSRPRDATRSRGSASVARMASSDSASTHASTRCSSASGPPSDDEARVHEPVHEGSMRVPVGLLLERTGGPARGPERWRTARNIATFRLLPTGRPFAWRSESDRPECASRSSFSCSRSRACSRSISSRRLHPARLKRRHRGMRRRLAPDRRGRVRPERQADPGRARAGEGRPRSCAALATSRARRVEAPQDPNRDSRGRTRPLGSSGR